MKTSLLKIASGLVLAFFLAGCVAPVPPQQPPQSQFHLPSPEEIAKQQTDERLARAKAYAIKHSDTSSEILQDFVEDRVEVGMTPEQVEVVRGMPDSDRVSNGVGGTIECIGYSYAEIGLPDDLFWFKNGKLVRWSSNR